MTHTSGNCLFLARRQSVVVTCVRRESQYMPNVCEFSSKIQFAIADESHEISKRKLLDFKKMFRLRQLPWCSADGNFPETVCRCEMHDACWTVAKLLIDSSSNTP